VVPFKDASGLTSTAVAYSDDAWEIKRRITMTELQQLPPTFDADTLRQCYDPRAFRLLPNTGCILMRYGDWLKSFPGFSILDRITRVSDSQWRSDVVPEDWHFGYWAGRNGVKVGGTKAAVTRHYGRQYFPSDGAWGQASDIFYMNHVEAST